MAPTVIVAIPSEEDYVNKISSEKVAHMTMLFLDDLSADDAQHVTEFLEHTANTSLHRAGLQVDRRGTLGPDDADVVFFDNSENAYGGMKMFREARSYLLKDPVIAKAVAAVEQYPEWTPHLTLGYSTAPAHEDDRDYPGVHWINFDRVALWTGDFEGFTIPLKSDDRMAMTDNIESFLAHYGKKGMRWGVRKDRSKPSAGTAAPEKAAPKKTEAPTGGKPKIGKGGRIENVQRPTLHTVSDEELRKAIARINMERQYADLTRVPVPKTKAEAVRAAVAGVAANVVKDVVTTQAKSALNSLADKKLVEMGIVPAKKKK